MATSVYTYDALFETMKNRFTVVHDNCEYTLGGYMRTKAAERCGASQLPATLTQRSPVAMRRFLSIVNEKLTVKEVPSPDKALTTFPFRTALTSLAAAFVLCTMVFSFARLSMMKNTITNQMPSSDTAESVVEELPEHELTSGFATC